MKRFLLLLTAILVIQYTVPAQQVKAPASKMKFDIGPQFSYPINASFNRTHGIGLGASSRAAYYFTDEISTGIRINYDYFLGRKYVNNGVTDRWYNATWTSFLANFQYDFKGNVYIGGDAGLGLISIRGNTGSAFNSSLYMGSAFRFLKSHIGTSFYWTQARQSSIRYETTGLRLRYRFN